VWYKFFQQTQPIVMVGKYQIKDAGNQWEVYRTDGVDGQDPAAMYPKTTYPNIDQVKNLVQTLPVNPPSSSQYVGFNPNPQQSTQSRQVPQINFQSKNGPPTSAYPNAPYTPPTAPKTFKEYADLENEQNPTGSKPYHDNVTDESANKQNYWQNKEDQGLNQFLQSKGKSINDPFDVNLYNQYMNSPQYVQNAEYQNADYDWQKTKNNYPENWMRPPEPKPGNYPLEAYNMIPSNLMQNGGTLNSIYNSMAKQDPHKTNQLINYLKSNYNLSQGTQSVTGPQLYDAIQKLDI